MRKAFISVLLALLLPAMLYASNDDSNVGHETMESIYIIQTNPMIGKYVMDGTHGWKSPKLTIGIDDEGRITGKLKDHDGTHRLFFDIVDFRGFEGNPDAGFFVPIIYVTSNDGKYDGYVAYLVSGEFENADFTSNGQKFHLSIPMTDSLLTGLDARNFTSHERLEEVSTPSLLCSMKWKCRKTDLESTSDFYEREVERLNNTPTSN